MRAKKRKVFVNNDQILQIIDSFVQTENEKVANQIHKDFLSVKKYEDEYERRKNKKDERKTRQKEAAKKQFLKANLHIQEPKEEDEDY